MSKPAPPPRIEEPAERRVPKPHPDGLWTARTSGRRDREDAAMAWVYILRCADGSYYVGSTRNLERRIEEHQSGVGAIRTRRRLPVELVFAEEYERVDEAYEREKQIQGWSRRKREALIARSFESLPGLSGSRYRRGS